MPLLAFETSCDETSAAVVHRNTILSNVVSSQTLLHAEYGGVVPELAAREHLRNLLPVARTALQRAGIAPRAVEAIAATQGPGLPSALMVGLKAAQALAFSLRRPFIGVHHHEAHLYSPWIHGEPPVAEEEEVEDEMEESESSESDYDYIQESDFPAHEKPFSWQSPSVTTLQNVLHWGRSSHGCINLVSS